MGSHHIITHKVKQIFTGIFLKSEDSKRGDLIRMVV